jgi:hypothetical protein
MRFNRIQYIEWFKKKSPVGIDLCSSRVDPIKGEDLDTAWAELEVSGENFYGYIPSEAMRTSCQEDWQRYKMF